MQILHPQLKEEIFGLEPRLHLLHQVVVMQLINRRSGTAATQSKGFVSGGGKKPWKQKGTGRARAGSIRSPIWVGGGTTFGPQPRDYYYRMPKRARKEALLSALSLKRKEEKLVIVDRFDLEEPKTKLFAKLLDELKLKSTVVLTAGDDDKVTRAARNLPKVKVVRIEGLNVYDLMRYDSLLLEEQTLKTLEERLLA